MSVLNSLFVLASVVFALACVAHWQGADVGHRVWEMNKQHGGKAGVEYANLLKSVLLMDYSMMQVTGGRSASMRDDLM